MPKVRLLELLKLKLALSIDFSGISAGLGLLLRLARLGMASAKAHDGTLAKRAAG